MKQYRLKDMKGGWFVGGFQPAALNVEACETACKRYEAGESEGKHLHKVATEVTLIASGKAVINGLPVQSGDIIVLEPGEAADFLAVEDTVTMVVKVPSVKGDKYIL